MPGGATIPAETDLLCEGCGYVLSGLPTGPDARCPECGKPVEESDPAHRSPAAWEAEPGFVSLLLTSVSVLFRPTRFYRTLATRRSAGAARRFGALHMWLASLLFAVAGHTHWRTFVAPAAVRFPKSLLELAVFVVVTYAFIALTTRLAGWLTAWEASYRGIRLPRTVVQRGMYYHAVHYLPVAFVAAATVVVYRALLYRELVGPASTATYLYTLCGEVVLAAVYLFKTYWIGMRNMMYANR
jgi:hypothetical protein